MDFLAGQTKIDELNSFIDKYYRRIYNFCSFKLHNQADAQDCCQDVFILFYSKFDSIRNKDQVDVWLYRTANNYCKRYAKSYEKKQKQLISIDEDNGRQFVDDSVCIEDSLDLFLESQVDIHPYVQQILEQLSEKELSLWYLYFKEEKKIAEVAAILKISEASVKSRAFRLKIKLINITKQVSAKMDDKYAKTLQ